LGASGCNEELESLETGECLVDRVLFKCCLAKFDARAHASSVEPMTG